MNIEYRTPNECISTSIFDIQCSIFDIPLPVFVLILLLHRYILKFIRKSFL
jgi:hypothetical protein